MNRVTFLLLVQLWESFSFFGMRALLVLYLISEVGFSTQDAFLLYTLYVASVKVFAGVGGYVTDRFVGYKKGVLIGGGSIALGHLCLTFSSLFYLGLGSIVCGSALFRVSLQALLSLQYGQRDVAREKGFTLLYVAMNLGGLIAAVLCGFVAQSYGWHAGFGLAFFAMLIGLSLFSYKMGSLPNDKKGSSPLIILLTLTASVFVGTFLHSFQLVHPFVLPVAMVAFVLLMIQLGKKMAVAKLVGAFLLLIAYFTAEELWGSLLMVFAETHIARTLFGFEIPSAVIAAINPLTIIVASPFVAKSSISFATRLSVAFFCLTSAFFILYAASVQPAPSLLYMVFGLGSIALGELFLAPTVLSYASGSAPKELLGTMMGTTTVAFAMGTLLSGQVTKISDDPSTVFLWMGCGAFALFLLLFKGVSLKIASGRRQ